MRSVGIWNETDCENYVGEASTSMVFIDADHTGQVALANNELPRRKHLGIRAIATPVTPASAFAGVNSGGGPDKTSPPRFPPEFILVQTGTGMTKEVLLNR